MKSNQTTRMQVISTPISETMTRPVNGQSVPPLEVTPSDGGISTKPAPSCRRLYVLGEGGSGIATILTYKRVLKKRGVFVPNSIRYRGFDNDPRYKKQFDPEEFMDWSGVNLGNFLRVALANPTLFPGLYHLGDLASLLEELKPVEILIGGCRDNRRIAKSLYERQAELAGDQLISDLLAPANDLRWAGQGVNGTDSDEISELTVLIIIQIFSAGGAKGNTAALCDAWVIRHQLQETGFDKFRIDPVIYLPEVFNTTKQERIKANTHAFLVELAAVYTRLLSPLKIGPLWVERSSPYGLIKLMNGVDEQGWDYRRQEVYDIEAECFRLSNVGPTGDFFESLIPNVVDELSWPYVGYSQNCLLKVLPVGELQTLFGLRQAKMQLEHLVHQPDPAETKRQGRHLAQEWLHQQHITPRAIGHLILPGLNSRQIAAELKPYQKLKLAALENALAKYGAVKLPAWQEAAVKEVEQLVERLDDALIQFVGNLINRPEYSPSGVRFVLADAPEEQVAGIAHFLAELATILERKLSQAQTELDRQRNKLARRGFILTRLFFKLFPRLRKRRRLKLTLAILSLELLALKLQAQLEVANRLAQTVQAHSQAMRAWEATLKTGRQLAAEQARHYANQRQHRPIFEENILSQAEEETLFAERIDQVFTLGCQGISFRWQAGQWQVQCGPDDQPVLFERKELGQQAGLERFLSQYVLDFWNDLEELSLEAILEGRGDDPVAAIAGMKNRCNPLISIDHDQHKAQGGDDAVSLRREYILGTQFGKQRLFQNYNNPQGFEIVATGQAGRHRLELLSTVFYVNPLALTQSGAYQAAYDRLRASGHNPHIFDAAELGLTEQEDK